MTLSLSIVTTLLLAGGIGFGLMHAQLSSRQDARVTEMYGSLEAAMTGGDQADLLEAVASRIAASPDQASIYLLKDLGGQVLAANIHGIDLPGGWSIVPADLAGVTTNYPYRVFTGTAGNYSLSVGLTDADLDDLREIMAAAFGWSALTVLLATLGIAVVLARRMDRRLAAVDHSLNRVAHGELSARLALSGRGDDLDRIALTINGALERLEGVVAAMRQVSTDIAHDLRTPLNRLRIRIEAAAAKAEAGQGEAEDLRGALAEVDQINQTFAALLRIAQIETGSRRAGFRVVDVAKLLGDVAEIYRAVAEDAGQVMLAMPGGSCLVNGDPELLTQMFANLIENAIQHGPPGTKISCFAGKAAGRVCAGVADTGPGIPAAERENVQRRLYRLHKSRSTPGSGLGLSLVRAIADLHHANLTLRDRASLTLCDRASLTLRDRDGAAGLRVEISFPAA